MKIKRNKNMLEADLHGLRRDEALLRLTTLVTNAPAEIQEILVVHGCHGGTVLRDMVRTEFSHPRVSAILKTLDDGRTRLLLRQKK